MGENPYPTSPLDKKGEVWYTDDMSTNGEILKGLVDTDFGLTGYGNWFRAREHNSLVIDYQSGIFFWNSKEIIGGPKDYLIKVRNMTETDAIDLIKLLGSDATVDTIYVERDNKEATVIYQKLVDILWNNGKTERKYWYDRLIDDATIDRFRLGFYDGWYTVPFFYGDNMVNIQKRRDEPEKRIKAWYRGVKPVLFNKDIMRITSKVVMTEGLVDAILLNQYGIPSISKVGGASTWNDEWLKFFERQKRVYLLFDNDEAGRKGARRFAQKLGEYRCKIYTFEEYKEKYDVIDFFKDKGTVEELKELVFNNSKYSFEI